MVLDDVEKIAGARFGAVLDDLARQRVAASQTIRILPDHQFLLQRIRLKNQPLVECRALRRSELRGKPHGGVLIDEMEYDSRSLGDDQMSIHQSRDTSVWIHLEIC